ncbi:Dbl homology domain-containing protein [Piedraia hortae CBS 480.64]|uniref:Dbl homology domain-containing protein n=1 Tax=Piedraia hortae CBS 480.64 TaxID=1314780 RepID=A0A6A7BSL5_9PEZI|nr:Dbl homology domain-containing protein [Piedraia hortae CBS 480.64]
MSKSLPAITPKKSKVWTVASEEKPFSRWMSQLRRRKQHQVAITTPSAARWPLDDFDEPKRTEHSKPTHHKQSSSGGSSGFVATIKTATSASMATLSNYTNKLRQRQDRSSVTSDPRTSVDSQRGLLDAAARTRSQMRREKVLELLHTEESYVADLKTLCNVLSTVLGYRSDSGSLVRKRASLMLSHLIHLHQDIIAELRIAIPFSDGGTPQRSAPSHSRWNSVDGSVPRLKSHRNTRQAHRSLDISRRSEDETMFCSPDTITAVANIFLLHLPRLAEYADFGVYFEVVRADVEHMQQSIAIWPKYDIAIEALAHATDPAQCREANARKASTLKDLLIKPIQRLPRYELLFGDLSRLTPAFDDPSCHSTIETLLDELKKVCHRIDQASADRDKLQALERTWLVGERLNFSGQVPRSIFLQLLGQVVLCGCLYVSWHSKTRIKGNYLVCILFKSTLLLACAVEGQQKYSALVGISLDRVDITSCENGSGLQCSTTPYTWKLEFERGTQVYELLLTACSSVEANVWRENLTECITTQSRNASSGIHGIQLHSPLVTEMRSIGKNYHKKNFSASCPSVRRAATLSEGVETVQVVIKNTLTAKEALEYPTTRSQTVSTLTGDSNAQILAPRRADRVRLESLLADVWTKDLLPYPGMTSKMTDPLRASASNVIRKLSIASFASGFSASKRCVSSGPLGKETMWSPVGPISQVDGAGDEVVPPQLDAVKLRTRRSRLRRVLG